MDYDAFVRLLTRLHPPSFRRRFGADTVLLFREWVRAAPTAAERLRRERKGARDAVRTLGLAWTNTLIDQLTTMMTRGGKGMDVVWHGIRSSMRMVRRKPLQAAVVIGTLAVAVGANTTLFSVAKSLLIRPLPYADVERVVQVKGGATSLTGPGAYEVDEEFRTTPGIELTAYYLGNGWANLTDAGPASRVSLVQVSPEFFDVLGVSLAIGSGLPEVREGEAVAVLSDDLWRRAFGADRGVLGRSVTLNGRSYRVVGVAPPEVSYPAGTEAWLSLPVAYDFYSNAVAADAIARVAPGVALSDIEATLLDRYAEERREWEAEGYTMPPLTLVPLRRELVRDVEGPILVLFGAAGLVLLLGCLNLAGVWAGRIEERKQELGMRRALGASRRRVVATIVSETTSLALLGGLAGVGVAGVGVQLFRSYLPGEIPGVAAIALDGTTLGFALLVTVGVGAAFGGLAARLGSRTDPLAWGRRGTDSVESRRFQRFMSVGQGALATVLLAGSLLAVRSFDELRSDPMGFEADGSLMLSLRMPINPGESAEAPREFARSVRERIGSVPGVTSVGIINSLPLQRAMLRIDRYRPVGGGDESIQTVEDYVASGEYFEAAGIPILAGSPLDDGDLSQGDEVILDADVAQAFFGGGVAVGQTIERWTWRDGAEHWDRMRVRAVVGRVRTGGPRSTARSAAYRSYESSPASYLGILVRVAGRPAEFIEPVRTAAAEVDPTIVPYGVATTNSVAGASIATDRALAAISSGFSASALFLVALGLYGLVGQQVSRRRREFGVRLALGAQPSSLVGTMTQEGVRIGTLALILGLPVSLAAAKALEARLFRVDAWDFVSLGGAAVCVLLLSVAAAWLPARRVVTVDPSECLAVE